MKGKRAFQILVLLICFGLLTYGCSKTKDEEVLFKEAEEALKQGNPELAEKAYKDIIEHYPDSPNTSAAFFKLGLVYLNQLNKQELADRVFRKLMEKYPDFDLEKEFFQEAFEAQQANQPQWAINAYQTILKLDSDGPNAHKALFLTGFVYSEQLKDTVKAKEAFQKVIDNYPDCDLIEDAKFMLEAVGKDTLPEKMLKSAESGEGK